MIASFLRRWPFLAAVALVCAAVSDVLVESVANAGFFGSAYSDTNDSSIVPALIAAILLAVYVIGLHVLALLRRPLADRRDRLVDAARAVAAHPPWRDFAAIVVMQCSALLAMESLEQVASTGHLAGGSAWLGGPLVAAMAAHVLVGAAGTLAAGWLMRVSVARFASLVCRALDFVLCALGARGGPAFVVRRDAASCSHAQPVAVRHISGRAPPFRPIAA